jgi:hypothetical protein
MDGTVAVVIPRAAALPLGLALLAGCSGSGTSLSSRPAHLDAARALAEAVAQAGSCGSLEDLGAHDGSWAFTCQVGQRSFTITAVSSPRARLQ